MDKIIENRQFDEERALYNLNGAEVRNCLFAGPADGESAFKEARGIKVSDSRFLLRYPFWHVEDFELSRIEMTDSCRAALWYDRRGRISGSSLGGIKALRECRDIKLSDCKVSSEEFGWKCGDVSVEDSEINSQYAFLDSVGISLERVKLKGKYSFQYTVDLKIGNSVLDTKDAFWHSRNATVRDSVIKGEYLGWYSEGLTLVNCKITGTQPLCYCKGLTLINCTMEGCDLAFEYSDVRADIRGRIESVKNPRSGKITADGIGEVILQDAVMPCDAEISVR